MLEWASLPIIVWSAVAAPRTLCSVAEFRDSPGYQWRIERVAAMVDSARQIVRVRAVRADSASRTVSFEPLEWIRGKPASPATIVLPGVSVWWDDFNDLPVPCQLVRPAGRRGNCVATEYRVGSQYLLLLRLGAGRSPISWWPLGPVNEQLHGDGVCGSHGCGSKLANDDRGAVTADDPLQATNATVKEV